MDDEKLSPMEWRYHMLGAKGDDRTHDWLVLERHDQAMRAELERVGAERDHLIESHNAEMLGSARRFSDLVGERDEAREIAGRNHEAHVVSLRELVAWQKRVLESDEPVLKQPITRFHEARAVVEGETPQP